jgi:hypothetical protein
MGTWAFGDTRWASDSGGTFLIAPLTVFSLYAFIVHFSRRNYALVVAGCAALVLGPLADWGGSRFALMPLVLVFLDRVLRKPSWGRCWSLMATVVATSIVTPESTLLVLGVLAVLVAAEFVHRRRGGGFPAAFPRTLRCAATGAALTTAWFVFLAATGCLSGFVAYYLTTISGHELWGPLPIHWPLPGDARSSIEFVLPLLLFLLVAAKVAMKIHSRSAWKTTEWVLLAAATAVPLIWQVPIDRFDNGHVSVAFQAATPFVLLWSAELVSIVDMWIRQKIAPRVARLRAPRWSVATPAALLALVVVVTMSPLEATSTLAARPAAFHVVVPSEAPTEFPLGYIEPGGVDIPQLQDLAAVIERYAGRSAPVFDFVNEMGVPYFLLDRVPGARFYHVEAAQTAAAQKLEVEDLQHSRPPVVIFNDHTYGIPSYDGIWSMERNYLVSQYLLDNYKPFADVHGQLVMLRNDMVATAPPLPPLHQAAKTTDLYFSNLPACDWGTTPNFLKPPTAEEIGAGVPASPSATAVSASGWAFDAGAHRTSSTVLAVRGGGVVAEATPAISRPDVAANLRDPAAASSGWTMVLPSTALQDVVFYALNPDGTVSPLPRDGGNAPSAVVVRGRSGQSYRVVTGRTSGHVDGVPSSLLALSVPGTAPITGYQWLELHSDSGFNSHIILTDDATPLHDSPHNISFDSLPRAGNTVYLRVGSCIQWHGYETRTLLLQGAPAGVSLRLLP